MGRVKSARSEFIQTTMSDTTYGGDILPNDQDFTSIQLTCDEETKLRELIETRNRFGIHMNLSTVRPHFAKERWLAIENACFDRQQYDVEDFNKPKPEDYNLPMFINNNDICWLNSLIHVTYNPSLTHSAPSRVSFISRPTFAGSCHRQLPIVIALTCSPLSYTATSLNAYLCEAFTHR
jgi:hypothetical protein